MGSSSVERTQIAYARLAGLMYLLVDAGYVVGLLITGHFRVADDFTATAHNVMAGETLYRLGLASGLIGALCTVFLAVGLYVALKPIDGDLALLALTFRLVEATLFGAQSVFSFAGVRLYGNVSAFDADQLSFLASLRSGVGLAGFNVAATFFGVGSIVFFYLFVKSGYIPRSLSVLGLIGSVLVPLVCLGTLIAPGLGSILQFGWAPIAVAEIIGGLWLLIKGVRVQPPLGGAS